NEQIKDALNAQKENNDFMKDFLAQTVSSMTMENTLTLTEIKNLITGSGSGQKDLEVYSDFNKGVYLSQKAADLKEKCQHVILIHPHGIGAQSYQPPHGTNGNNGRPGVSQYKGRNGAPGNFQAADGNDGDDAEDGGDGEAGEDAEDGSHSSNFEVMIIFLKD